MHVTKEVRSELRKKQTCRMMPTRFDAAYSGATAPSWRLGQSSGPENLSAFRAVLSIRIVPILPLLLYFSGRFKKEKDSFNYQAKKLGRCDQFGIFMNFGGYFTDDFVLSLG